MANKCYGANSYIGGADGDLDAIAKAVLTDGDLAIVVDAVANESAFYTLNSSSAESEDGVDYTVIVPDDEAASPGKRWIMTGSRCKDLEVFGTTIIDGAVTMGTTLSVTGNTTVGGTLGVTGNIDVNSQLTVTASNGSVTATNGTFTVGALTTPFLDIGSTITLTGTLDEDNMSSNSAVKLATQQSIKAYVDTQVAAGAAAANPAGTVISYAGTGSVPTGYLDCNGAAVSRTTYADLFTAISTRYGVGNGSTTFNVPDYRGYFLRGYDAGAGNDPDAASRTDSGDGSTTGDNIGTKQATEHEAHTHSATRNVGIGTAAANYITKASQTFTGTEAITTGSSGGNESRPLNISVRYIIKT